VRAHGLQCVNCKHNPYWPSTPLTSPPYPLSPARPRITTLPATPRRRMGSRRQWRSTSGATRAFALAQARDGSLSSCLLGFRSSPTPPPTYCACFRALFSRAGPTPAHSYSGAPAARKLKTGLPGAHPLLGAAAARSPRALRALPRPAGWSRACSKRVGCIGHHQTAALTWHPCCPHVT